MGLIAWFWPRITEEKLEYVRSVLRKWDPLGVIVDGEPKDEYDSYAHSIARLLARNSSERTILRKFLIIRRFNMSIPINYFTRESDQRIAKELIAGWKEFAQPGAAADAKDGRG